MSFTTSVRLTWKQGVSFSWLSKAMVDFFKKTDLHFDLWQSMGGNGIFKIARSKAKIRFDYIDAPWECDPMLQPGFLGAYWSLIEPDGSSWGDFVFWWESNPGSTLENVGTKIFTIMLQYEGFFFHYPDFTPKVFEEALRKYHLLKSLYETLDCDELVGINQQCVDLLDGPYFDPTHRDKNFRFAKEGTQVLVRQMEERRPMPELAWEDSRIFIDPPNNLPDQN